MKNKEYNNYLAEYCTIKDITKGFSADEVRSFFKSSITNDGADYIDINYKDILVTFDVNKRTLTDMFEVYDKNGQFVGEYLNVGYQTYPHEEFVEK